MDSPTLSLGRWRTIALAGLGALVATAVLAGCGGSTSDGSDRSLATGGWKNVVSAAKDEGTVTVYSTQAPAELEAFAKGFEKKYGIKVVTLQGLAVDLVGRLEAERKTDKRIADVFVSNSFAVHEPNIAAGDWYTPAVGPEFDAPEYNRSVNYNQGNVFVVGSAVATFGWNTDEFKAGLKDYTDLLDPALADGRVGIAQPTSAAMVDFYRYQEANYGSDFLEKLAAQKPRIYDNAFTLAEALASGEVAAANFVQPQTQAKADGAPVDSGQAAEVWGARFWGSVLDDSPSPNAAQLLADYMVSAEGQALISPLTASVLPGITEAFTDVSRVRADPDPAGLTQDKVDAYIAKWNGIFR